MTSDFYPTSAFKDGEFIRPPVTFRNWIKADGTSSFTPEAGRYHLYVSLACPWSHRTVLVRSLRKLEETISISVTHPIWNEAGWCFDEGPGVIPDEVNHKHNVIDLYKLDNPKFLDEETVPILWDKKTARIVNNESRDIMRMLTTEFMDFGDRTVNLCPPELRTRIDKKLDALYSPINNGVYKAGFAKWQKTYEQAALKLFEALNELESELGNQRYLCGDRLTEADLALFVTLVRFDSVYYSHFKCNRQRIVDYPNLWGWLRDMYQTPGIAETCNFEHIKNHYYRSQDNINPTRIVPIGPEIPWSLPHEREYLPCSNAPSAMMI